MMRILHRWLGLVLAVLLFVTALSGAALSLFPALESARSLQPDVTLTVADLAARVQAAHPGLEQIKRAPSGQISAWWFDGDQPGSAVIDPATGRDVASADPNPLRRWLTNLHRSLLLGDTGRMIVAAGALAMLLLAISGVVLVVRRLGGWRHWLARLRGPLAGRLHTDIARVAVLGLALSAMTALWMSAETFEIVTIDAASLETPATVSGQTGLALAEMQALRAVPAAELRELSFPAPDDPQDMFTLRTDRGMGYVDQGTGTLLGWQDLSLGQRASETIYMLHTGQGAAVLGLFLGVMALGVPVLAVTGVLVWLPGWRNRPQLTGNAPAAQADTIVLVGSEGGSTWGFAATLARALRDAGQSVHVAPMTAFQPARYRRARRFLILAATYGEGDAPASAKGFLARLQTLETVPTAPLAVLGFGDRSFPAFCAFARAVDNAARNKGWPALMAFDTIDRQSPQDFARWGRILGQALGIELELVHQPDLPATQTLTLLERHDYGAAVQAPMSILRFALPKASLWQRLAGQRFTQFEPGDLLGIVPEGSAVPRLYSLASGSRDGFIEIVVHRHVGGLTSGQLTQLEPGQTAQGFLRRHPGFHAGRDRTPLILIGAGTGVGPLAGFIRNNKSHRPVHLFFGLRQPDSDFLYRNELSDWQADGKLAHLSIAVSRGERPQYVQDALRQQAPRITAAISQGARIMVCGGRDMARGVADALTDILKPTGLTPAMLKVGDRYVEDIY
ncbi:sulfite reductase (NADPH) flavoprotein alpha-component [Steroidobacter denitrificans]|uniref:NADPH--hemoprotein reductase n=1 Tax=Steroidobacter denitrificans TaxID=465721 RepID=A0A127F9P2_STEDE|nr:PepSY domain-containing protein [Steroidobacter denitrificans]AMN47133.1 sulfite reductase (NADPH) flavoprotein alpha-component [Steroidobacter denitrificans]